MKIPDQTIIKISTIVADSIEDPSIRHNLRQKIAIFAGLSGLKNEVRDGPAKLRKVRAHIINICAKQGVQILKYTK